MQFRDAIDRLFERIDIAELASRMGTRPGETTRQLTDRLRRAIEHPENEEAPSGWEHAVVSVAEDRLRHYRQLINNLALEQKHSPRRAEPRFRVFERTDGPLITLELLGGDDLEMFHDTTIGFHVAPGTTFEQAKEIADYLQRHLRHVSETKLPGS